jgi:hypothetical protein
MTDTEKPPDALAESTGIIAPPPTGGWLGVIDKLIDRGVAVADLQKIFEMQQQYLKEQARLAFKRDYAAFRAECPRLEKDKLVSFTTQKGTTSYKHILIATAVDTLTPIMSRHNLSHRWETRQKDGGVIEVTCFLEHSAGHSETATLWGQADVSGSKNPIQAVASTVTYLQRYTFLTVTGAAAYDGDNDGNGGGHGTASEDDVGQINTAIKAIRDAEAAATVAGKIIDKPFNFDRFLEWLEIKGLQDLPADKVKSALTELERKRKAVPR